MTAEELVAPIELSEPGGGAVGDEVGGGWGIGGKGGAHNLLDLTLMQIDARPKHPLYPRVSRSQIQSALLTLGVPSVLHRLERISP